MVKGYDYYQEKELKQKTEDYYEFTSFYYLTNSLVFTKNDSTCFFRIENFLFKAGSEDVFKKLKGLKVDINSNDFFSFIEKDNSLFLELKGKDSGFKTSIRLELIDTFELKDRGVLVQIEKFKKQMLYYNICYFKQVENKENVININELDENKTSEILERKIRELEKELQKQTNMTTIFLFFFVVMVVLKLIEGV